MNTRPQGMPCPIDGTSLVMSDRHGIEIDYCPACRGVWLDRGELDKIVERSAADSFAHGDSGHARSPYPAQPHDFAHYKRKRRKSFLEELFD